MSENHKYSIREVSEICNIPSKTLRYYDEIKLVVPEFRDEINRYRYYSKNQLITLCIIRKLRTMDFGLKEIQNIITGNKADGLEKNIEQKLEELLDEINCLQKKYASTNAFLQRLKTGVDLLNIKGEICLEDIAIEEIPETNLVFTRKTMTNYSNIDVSVHRWVEILNLCDDLNIKNKGTIIVTYYCNPLEQFLFTDTDIEFGTTVDAIGDGECFRTFGNFTAATAIHVGNYADIIHTHIRLVQWINQNQYKIIGPISEEFIISPLDINNINEHVTKIIIPIEKKHQK
ncbi:multidrug-efflux transporter 1 regulator [Anaerotignum neopropionicum]|uniref:Multidrug-efflux transporter 1 regulator n=1 Tax=Anaerotignum neopropionicum TaxID=36847 RepID=A0A136WD94_9FIRM|nr:MerR family transcriptional regulator [Anaerotignum neopropionicum]KXL52485.1 multidrug-efflux transporter 1 regulator [Anaerotignum neopropionicum]